MGKVIFRNQMGAKLVTILMGIGVVCMVAFLYGARNSSATANVLVVLCTLGLPTLLLLGMRFAQPDLVNEVLDMGDTLQVRTNSLGSRGAFSMPKGQPTKWGVEAVKNRSVNNSWLAFEHEGRMRALNIDNPDYFDVEAFRSFAPDAVNAALQASAARRS